MSNYLAVATVTAALSQTIRSAIDVDVAGATVTVTRPHSPGDGDPPDAPTVNLYLFQVLPNKSLRNNNLPTRSSDGVLNQRSQLALDLNYLVTFYGNEKQLEPQRLLGSVMRTLNSRPILSRELIKNTVDPGGSFPYLDGSDLADAIESVKFSPIPFSLEELSKLWSVFLQTPYTLSVAFQGTVVLLDGLESPSTPLPVRASNLYVNPFRQPVIDNVESEEGADFPIDASSSIVIRGKELRGDLTRVRIGWLEIMPPQVSNTLIKIDLATIPATELRSGIQAVQIIQPLLIGSPAVPHPGVESSAAPVTIVPIITDIDITNIQVIDDNLRAADITIQINPNIGKNQRVVLMMNELVNNDPLAYTFVLANPIPDNLVPPPESVNSVTISVSNVKAAIYLVRVMVDGSTSQLTMDSSTGAYNGPTVDVS